MKALVIIFGILLVLVIGAMLFIPAASVGVNPQQAVATVQAEANTQVDNASQATGLPEWVIWVIVAIVVIILLKLFFR